MRLRSLALEFVPPQSGPRALRLAVEQVLAGHGQPLRWAITRAGGSSVYVEAVVLEGVVLEGAGGEPPVGARELP